MIQSGELKLAYPLPFATDLYYSPRRVREINANIKLACLYLKGHDYLDIGRKMLRNPDGVANSVRRGIKHLDEYGGFVKPGDHRGELRSIRRLRRTTNSATA